MTPTNTVTWYVARTHDGQFNRGLNWTPHFERARLVRKIGPVKSAISHYVKDNPNNPVPQILEWTLSTDAAKVIDDTEGARKRATKRATAKVRKEQARIKWDLEHLQREEQRLAEKRARLEGRA